MILYTYIGAKCGCDLGIRRIGAHTSFLRYLLHILFTQGRDRETLETPVGMFASNGLGVYCTKVWPEVHIPCQLMNLALFTVWPAKSISLFLCCSLSTMLVV